jgi:hypothetical protein
LFLKFKNLGARIKKKNKSFDTSHVLLSEKLRIDVVMCNQDAFLAACHLYQRYDASDYVSRKKQSSYFRFRFQPGLVTARFSAGKIKKKKPIIVLKKLVSAVIFFIL